MKCTIQICFEREAQAHRQDTQLDNKKVTKTSPTSKVISYRQCLDLHCISIRIETLKKSGTQTHFQLRALKELVPKNTIQAI